MNRKENVPSQSTDTLKNPVKQDLTPEGRYAAKQIEAVKITAQQVSMGVPIEKVVEQAREIFIQRSHSREIGSDREYGLGAFRAIGDEEVVNPEDVHFILGEPCIPTSVYGAKPGGQKSSMELGKSDLGPKK